MNTQNPNKGLPENKGNFIRAMIKINNPSWTEDQIEQELKKKLIALENPDNTDEACDMCSG